MISKKISSFCDQCGKKTSKFPSVVKRNRGNFCSVACSNKHKSDKKELYKLSNTGSKNYNWKGDDIKYQALHSWLRSKYGNANRCENPKCSRKSKNYVWAKKKGKAYLRRRSHFFQLCRSCHVKYDMTKEWREKIGNSMRGIPRPDVSKFMKGNQYARKS